jgi:hypothetical protein
MANFSCPTTIPEGPCPRAANMGWRYFLFAMGGLMLFFFFIRFFVFDLYESPKYLMGRGKEKLAVEIVHKVAEYNGKTSKLTVNDLRRAGKYPVRADEPESQQDTSALAAVRRQFRKFSGDHVRALFAKPKLAWSTSLLIIIWGLYSFESFISIVVLMVCY